MAALAAEVVGSFLYGGAGPVQVCGDLEVCGFNHWQIKTLREYDCRDIVLVQPTTRSKKKPTATMKAWYKRIKNRRGSKIARVAVMSRLATVLWHMLKHKEPYAFGGPPKLQLCKAA